MSWELSAECRRWIVCVFYHHLFDFIHLIFRRIFFSSSFTPLCTMWLAPDIGSVHSYNNQLRYNSKITYPLLLLIIRLRTLRIIPILICFFLRLRSDPIPFFYYATKHYYCSFRLNHVLLHRMLITESKRKRKRKRKNNQRKQNNEWCRIWKRNHPLRSFTKSNSSVNGELNSKTTRNRGMFLICNTKIFIDVNDIELDVGVIERCRDCEIWWRVSQTHCDNENHIISDDFPTESKCMLFVIRKTEY